MSEVWAVGMAVFCSSHDDFIGVFSSEEKANEARDCLNKNWQETCNKDNFWPEHYGEPYYSYSVDVSEFDGYKSCRELDSGYQHDEWIAVYGVPSVGKFKLFPKRSTAIEYYKLDEYERPKEGE